MKSSASITSSRHIDASLEYLVDASPSSRARLRELLESHDRVLEGRIAALAALSSKERALRRNVQFERRSARHELLCCERGGGAWVAQPSQPDRMEGQQGLVAGGAAAGEGVELGAEAAEAFARARDEIGKMFHVARVTELKKAEKEARRLQRERYGTLLTQDIGGPLAAAAVVPDDASEATLTMDGSVTSGLGGGIFRTATDGGAPQGLRFASLEELRRRLHDEHRRRADLAARLSDHLAAYRGLVAQRLAEADKVQGLAALAAVPDVCDCPACMSHVAAACECVRTEATRFLDIRFGPPASKEPPPRSPILSDASAASSSASASASASMLKGRAGGCKTRQRIVQDVEKLRRRYVQLAIQRRRLELERDGSAAVLAALSGATPSPRALGRRDGSASALSDLREAAANAEGIDELLVAYRPEVAAAAAAVGRGRRSAEDLGPIPLQVHCVALYRALLQRLAARRHRDRRALQRARLMDAAAVLTQAVLPPLELVAKVLSAESAVHLEQ